MRKEELDTLRPVSASVATKAANANTTKSADHAVQNLRGASHNTLHAAALVLLDTEEQQKVSLIAVVMEPIRQWQGLQTFSNVSSKATFQFYLRLASGGILESVSEVFATMTQTAALQKAGIHTSRMFMQQPDSHSLYCSSQNDRASDFGDLVVRVAAARLLRTMWWWDGPGKLVLLAGNAEQQRECLAWMRRWDLAVTAAKEHGERPLVKTMVERGFLEWPFVKHCFALARSQMFQSVSADLSDLCRKVFSGFGQTKLVESAVGCSRRAENREHEHGRPGLAHLWMAPIKAKLLSYVNSYPEIHALDPGEFPAEGWLGKEVFRPNVGCFAPDPLTTRTVLLTPARLSWPTFSAASMVQLMGDLHVIEAAIEGNAWQDLDKSWLTVLAEPTMLLRKRGEQAWYFKVATVWGRSLLLTLARELAPGVYQPVLPLTMANLRWGALFDIEAWDAWRFQWMAPCGQGNPDPTVMSQGLTARTVGVAETLLRAAARTAFGDMPKVALRKLQQFVQSPSASGHLYDVLFGLVSHCLPEESEDSVVAILGSALPRCCSQRRDGGGG